MRSTPPPDRLRDPSSWRLLQEERRFLLRFLCIWLGALSLLWLAKQPSPPAPREPAGPPASGTPGFLRSDVPQGGQAPALRGALVPEPEDDPIVYITKTGRRYHRESCSSLRKSRIPIRLSEVGANYTPCSLCDPPRRAGPP